MKYSITILFLATCGFAQAQTTVLTTDPSLPIPKLSFDEKGDLKITASATSSPSDFDFLVGKWKNAQSPAQQKARKLQGLDRVRFVWMRIPKPSMAPRTWIFIPPLRCQARRVNVSKDSRCGSLIRKTRLWSLYWVASNTGVLDPPVVGSFENNVGHFFCKDTFKEKPIIVMFRWDARNKDRPVWGQAFSSDNGKPGNGIGITSRSESLNHSSLLASWSGFRMTKLT